MTGRILRMHRERGFMFIKTDEDGSEIFAHCTNLVQRDFDQLRGDERVEFRVVEDRVKVGKLSALDVVVIG